MAHRLTWKIRIYKHRIAGVWFWICRDCATVSVEDTWAQAYEVVGHHLVVEHEDVTHRIVRPNLCEHGTNEQFCEECYGDDI